METKEPYPSITGELIIQSMNLMGYDALNLGGSEFLFNREFLSGIRDLASFPLLSANIRWEKEGFLSQPFLIKEIAGIKLGIIGITSPFLVKKEGFLDIFLKTPEGVLPPLISQLKKQKVDLIVVLSYLGFEGSSSLAKNVEGIDVIISANHWKITRKPRKVGNTIIMQATSKSKYLGVLTLTVDNKKRGIVNTRGRLVYLNDDVMKDQRIARLVNQHTKKVAEAKKAQRRKEEIDQDKIIKTLIKMSPEEYIESLKQAPPMPPSSKN